MMAANDGPSQSKAEDLDGAAATDHSAAAETANDTAGADNYDDDDGAVTDGLSYLSLAYRRREEEEEGEGAGGSRTPSRAEHGNNRSQRHDFSTMATTTTTTEEDVGDPMIPGIKFVDYRDESQLASVMRLVGKDLSEPYSVFTYRYFLHRFPDLCILAVPDHGEGDESGDVREGKGDPEPVGCVVCKIDEEQIEDGAAAGGGGDGGDGSGSGTGLGTGSAADSAAGGDSGLVVVATSSAFETSAENGTGGCGGDDDDNNDATMEDAFLSGVGFSSAFETSADSAHTEDGAGRKAEAEAEAAAGDVGAKADGAERSKAFATTSSDGRAHATHRTTIKSGYMAMLAVDTSYRHKGIGTALVQRVVRRMRRRGCSSVTLETEVSNKAAMRLYEERLGFIREELLVRYYLNWGDAYRLRLWFD